MYRDSYTTIEGDNGGRLPGPSEHTSLGTQGGGRIRGIPARGSQGVKGNARCLGGVENTLGLKDLRECDKGVGTLTLPHHLVREGI